MNNKALGNFLVAIMLLVIALWLFAVGYEDKPGHKCRWALCPYKGVKPSHYKEAVKALYEEGTDIYRIDLLHLQYPNDEYDQLEEKLFNPKK